MLEVEDGAGAEVAAGADTELSDPELDFTLLSPEDAGAESLPPSLEVEALSFDPPSDFGAAEDFEG